jgi:hypothetical protein
LQNRTKQQLLFGTRPVYRVQLYPDTKTTLRLLFKVILRLKTPSNTGIGMREIKNETEKMTDKQQLKFKNIKKVNHKKIFRNNWIFLFTIFLFAISYFIFPKFWNGFLGVTYYLLSQLFG